jgi:tetratricopeptide (TPR) repeat protein
MLQYWGEDPELSKHLTAGRRFLGEDAVLLLYEGTQRLAYAGSRAQRFFDEQRASVAARPPVAANRHVVGQPREARDEPLPPPAVQDSRARAERLFRRALVIDASLVEARIRLAHVLIDTDRHDEAVSELEAATRSPLPQLLGYYASLMIGRAQRARRQFDAARAAFERASSVYPTATAPTLGLSELAMARGDRTRALEHLSSGAKGSRAAVTEPWWTIERVHEPSAQTLLDDLRSRVR